MAEKRSRQHERSASSTKSPCSVSAQCGACTCIDEPYAHQLERKQRSIADLFEGIAPAPCEFLPIAGMEDPFRFRDKIASPFAPKRGERGQAEAGRKGGSGKRSSNRQPGGAEPTKSKGHGIPANSIACGMYAAHSHRIIPVDSCPVEAEVGRKVVRVVRQLMAKWGVAPYDEDAGTGFMRHVVVRVGHESGEVLVTLVTNAQEFPSGKNFARELAKRCPEITTVVQNVNLRATNAILGREEHVLYGPGFILDTLCGLSFRISSHSFYQVNARQTEVLYRCAIEMAGLVANGGAVLPDELMVCESAGGTDSKGEVHDASAQGHSHAALSRERESDGVRTGRAAFDGASFGAEEAAKSPLVIMDAYCGTGTIGLVAAKAGGADRVRVLGVDNVESAIRDAKQNAAHNGIENARFICDDATAYMRRMAAAGERLDVLMMDPPRAGSTREFVEATCSLAPERVVYISCNPATQARDARWFAEHGYQLQRIRPVDMFPHTDHVESVALLSKVERNVCNH